MEQAGESLQNERSRGNLGYKVFKIFISIVKELAETKKGSKTGRLAGSVDLVVRTSAPAAPFFPVAF